MQKPNPMDYPMTIDGDLQYQTDLQNWQAGLRNRLKANMAPDTIQVSRAEYEALQHTQQLYNELLFNVSIHNEGETRHETALRYIRRAEEPTLKCCTAINMPANGEGR